MPCVSSRREFGKTIAAAVAAPWWTFHPSSPPAGHQDRKLGFALVGLGGLATNQIAPALGRTRFCRLVGVVTGTPAKAGRWKARYGLADDAVYDYATMDRMARNPDIDVVYVVTPNALHAQHTIAAARAGKHVLCEKPMEVSPEKCETMIAECQRAHRQLAIAYRCRFEPHHRECVRLARERVFGPLRLVEAGFGFRIGDPGQWRLDPARSGGGPLMDVGIYALQTARMLTGEEPAAVSAVESKTDPAKFRGVEESLAFQLTFPGGVIASCTTTFNAAGPNAFTAVAERGSFGLNPAYGYAGLRGWRSDGRDLRFDPVDQFATEMDAFAQCILSGTATPVPGEEGLRDVRILMATYQAARTGVTVRLGP
jgi:predicted dehydrogenase